MKKSSNLFAVVFVVLVFASGCIGSNKFEQEVEVEKSAIKLTREVLSGGYKTVSTTELKSMLDKSEDFLLIDTMPLEASYNKNHIPGAKPFLFPIPTMETWDKNETAGKAVEEYKQLLGDDLNRKIVVYCGFVKCTRSHNGALWAVKLGYQNVYRYPGGIFAWKGAGYPLDSVE